ncbi:MAG: LarC family nickel insertion protein [Gammaproteobacteria bacterium (ex Lamellibrachia satsuma)]|nr:MAG: LarC family nickel insertion protein [Gammaproteobacteria bacterium (ex Lamellibrachia satsuma)]
MDLETKNVHLYINPHGGLAGDMFCAAILDARPDLFAPLLETLATLSLPPEIRISLDEAGGDLSGKHFIVRLPEKSRVNHGHTHYRDIKKLLEKAPLPEGIKSRAQDIFLQLAEAEAYVHGVKTESVTFHEVGNWDSIIDIVSASFLLHQLNITATHTAPLPLGGGRVMTAHGLLPVPAPATARLLEGLPLVDDDIRGERVTPTGAAILKSLDPVCQHNKPLVLTGTGYGFGSRQLEGMPNCVQILLFKDEERGRNNTVPGKIDQVMEINFDVDDQSPEELAIGLDRLRDHEGVLSITTLQGIGKAGRPVMQIQLLCRPDLHQIVATECFHETTTIGLRLKETSRWVLPRQSVNVELEGNKYQVKKVDRPRDAVSAKTELRNVIKADGQIERQRLRRTAETLVLAKKKPYEQSDS